MCARRSRSFWSLGYREARGHAVVVAVLLWGFTGYWVIFPPGGSDLISAMRGADFVQFYTQGRIALSGDGAALYDVTAQHALQAELVPASSESYYIPVYPPQTALAFAVFAVWPFKVAAILWTLTIIATYGWAVWVARRGSGDAFPDTRFVVAAAAAFPPFWSLVVHGQTTVFPLVGFTLGWLALERRQPFLAGLAFGLMAVKPQFGLVLALVVLSCRDWRMLAGGVVSLFLQAASVVAVFGSVVMVDYARVVRRLPELNALLEPRPYEMHSMTAVTGLLPGWLGTPVWFVLATVVVVLTVRVWRTTAEAAVRVGVLVVATVLVSPHVIVYDATVLALPVLWLGGWIRSRPDRNPVPTFWPTVYLVFVTLLFPTALFMRVQASVFVLGWWLVAVSRAVLQTADATAQGSSDEI
jgi:hypothetical protein